MTCKYKTLRARRPVEVRDDVAEGQKTWDPIQSVYNAWPPNRRPPFCSLREITLLQMACRRLYLVPNWCIDDLERLGNIWGPIGPVGPFILPDHLPTMQGPFRLLKLPDLSFETVYDHLGFMDLIQLAALSKRMKRLIQSMESSKKKLTYMSLKKVENEQQIGLSDESQGRKRKEFVLLQVDAKSKLEESQERSMCGRTWSTHQNEEGLVVFAEKSPEAILLWFEYFKNLFTCQINIHLEFGTNHSSFEALLVKTDLLHVADKTLIAFNGCEVSDFIMNHMMDNLHAKDLGIYATNRHGFKYDKILTRFPIITFGTCDWLSMEDVWKMFQGGICRQFSCTTYARWISKDINQFIKNWLNSDNITIELISFEVPSWALPMFPDDAIFNGIATTPGCKKREDAAEYYDRRIEYEEGRDIRRKDGLLATFVKGRRGRITLTVWYCLDPNSPADNN